MAFKGQQPQLQLQQAQPLGTGAHYQHYQQSVRNMNQMFSPQQQQMMNYSPAVSHQNYMPPQPSNMVMTTSAPAVNGSMSNFGQFAPPNFHLHQNQMNQHYPYQMQPAEHFMQPQFQHEPNPTPFVHTRKTSKPPMLESSKTSSTPEFKTNVKKTKKLKKKGKGVPPMTPKPNSNHTTTQTRKSRSRSRSLIETNFTKNGQDTVFLDESQSMFTVTDTIDNRMRWYLVENDNMTPFTFDIFEMKELYEIGFVTDDSLIWNEYYDECVPIRFVLNVYRYLNDMDYNLNQEKPNSNFKKLESSFEKHKKKIFGDLLNDVDKSTAHKITSNVTNATKFINSNSTFTDVPDADTYVNPLYVSRTIRDLENVDIRNSDSEEKSNDA